MPGLSKHDPIWDQARAGGQGRVYEDAQILLGTDFEGGNGTDIRRLGADSFAITLEDEPGGHDYSGKPYYVCFGIRNKLIIFDGENAVDDNVRDTCRWSAEIFSILPSVCDRIRIKNDNVCIGTHSKSISAAREPGIRANLAFCG